MDDAAADALLSLLTGEPQDELGRALRHAHLALLRHPLAARGAFRAIAAEGAAYAKTAEGAALQERLAGSALVRRGRTVWELATVGLGNELDEPHLPSQYIDALAHAVTIPDLESALARAMQPGPEDA